MLGPWTRKWLALSSSVFSEPLLPRARNLTFVAGDAITATIGQLDTRAVLRLSGKGVLQYLQKLVTTDVFELESTGAPLMYSALLNCQGRYLHDIFLQRGSGPEPSLLADVDVQRKGELMHTLNSYQLHHKVAIEDVSDSHTVWVRFGLDDAGISATQGISNGISWRRDPRLPVLGHRAIVENAATRGIDRGDQTVWRAHRRWRCIHGVAEGDSEIASGEAIPLEYCLDALHGISYTKGCYVGQESVARIHAKGVVRKRLMPFQIEGMLDMGPASAAGVHRNPSRAASPPVYDVYDAGGSLAAIGQVRVIEGDVGLAVVRLKSALTAIQEGEPLFLGRPGSQHTPIMLRVPTWWPELYLSQVNE